MAKPHEPTPPVEPERPEDRLLSLPIIPLTHEQKETLKNPLVSDKEKLRILSENAQANEEAIREATSKEPKFSSEIDRSPPPDGKYEAHKVAMVIYGTEKKLWEEELASDEAFRNRLEAIVKSEKNKTDSGHYKEDKKHGRGGR